MTFVKGQSGNPRGRPKENPELKLMCQAKTKAAVERLFTEMNDGDTSGARISAANAILDRGWGKPQQTMDVTHRKSPLDDLDAATLSALAKALGDGPSVPAGGNETDTRH